MLSQQILRNLRTVARDPNLFFEFDDNLREAFQQETELFVQDQLQSDPGLRQHTRHHGRRVRRWRRVHRHGQVRGRRLRRHADGLFGPRRLPRSWLL